MDCRLKSNKSATRCKKLRLIIGLPKRQLKWKEAKLKYPRLSPNGDTDRDNKKNKKDCRPFNKKRHREEYSGYYSNADLVVSPRIYHAFQDLRRGESLNQLKRTYSNSELDSAFEVLDDSRRGKRVEVYYE